MAGDRILRYTLAERVIHWVAGLVYVYLLLTGLAFYSPHLYWIATLLGGAPTSRYWLGVGSALLWAGIGTIVSTILGLVLRLPSESVDLTRRGIIGDCRWWSEPMPMTAQSWSRLNTTSIPRGYQNLSRRCANTGASAAGTGRRDGGFVETSRTRPGIWKHSL